MEQQGERSDNRSAPGFAPEASSPPAAETDAANAAEGSSFLIGEEQAATRHEILTASCRMGVSALSCLQGPLRLSSDGPNPTDWASIDSARVNMIWALVTN